MFEDANKIKDLLSISTLKNLTVTCHTISSLARQCMEDSMVFTINTIAQYDYLFIYKYKYK